MIGAVPGYLMTVEKFDIGYGAEDG